MRVCNRRFFVFREGCGIWDIDKVRLRMWARGWVVLGSCVDCVLFKGVVYIVDIKDWMFILIVFR